LKRVSFPPENNQSARSSFFSYPATPGAKVSSCHRRSQTQRNRTGKWIVSVTGKVKETTLRPQGKEIASYAEKVERGCDAMFRGAETQHQKAVWEEKQKCLRTGRMCLFSPEQVVLLGNSLKEGHQPYADDLLLLQAGSLLKGHAGT